MIGGSLWRKIERRAARFMHRDMIDLSSSVVSFVFDDVPHSALTTGAEIIEKGGGRATYYLSGSYDDPSDPTYHFQMHHVHRARDAGHEFGSHSFRHLDYQDCTMAEIAHDLDRNDRYFESISLAPPRHFAFPFGGQNPRVKAALAKRFETVRGVESRPNIGRADRALLKAVQLTSIHFDARVIERIAAAAAARPTWLILCSHAVIDEPNPYDIRPDELAIAVAAVQRHGLPMLTMSAAYAHSAALKRPEFSGGGFI